MTIQIKVTSEDIKDGNRNRTNSCPIARAAMRMIPNVNPDTVRVRDASIHWVAGSGFYESDLPDSAISFIKSFDGRKTVEPFDFEVIPQRVIDWKPETD